MRPAQIGRAGNTVVAAFGDDVGGAELAGKLLAGFVAAHRDDPFRSQLLCGQHGQQPNGAVTDDRV